MKKICKEIDLFQEIHSRKALAPWNFKLETCYKLLCSQFGTNSLFGFDIENLEDGICAAGALLAYVKNTQECAFSSTLNEFQETIIRSLYS